MSSFARTLYCSCLAFLFSPCLYAQQTGSQQDAASSQAHAGISDIYVAVPVAIMFAVGILILVFKLRQQRVRKLAGHQAHREDVHPIRRRFRGAA
jgi:Na+/melibiose symporter-like transporter